MLLQLEGQCYHGPPGPHAAAPDGRSPHGREDQRVGGGSLSVGAVGRGRGREEEAATNMPGAEGVGEQALER